MRVAIVVNRFPTLSETFIFNKVKGLVQSGLEVTVITHNPGNDFYAYKEDWKDISDKVKIVKAFSKKDILSIRLYAKIFSTFAESISFFRTITKGKRGTAEIFRSFLRWIGLMYSFDIIHFEYSGLAITYLDVIPHLKHAKIFVSCRGAAEQIKPLVDRDRATKLISLFKLADRVHCVSNDMLNTCVTLYGLNPSKAFVNRPAVDINKFERAYVRERPSNAPYLFCSTGRLHWKKGFEYALLAMKELKKRGYVFKYEIIGGGLELEKLVFMVHDLDIQDCVFFCGSLPSHEVKKKLETCDLYILPSLSEGISNAVLEALAMQLPVVASRAGGMDEVIRDKETGLLADAYHAMCLADKIEIIMKDEALSKRLSLNGHALVRTEFTLDRQIEMFIKQYNQALHV